MSDAQSEPSIPELDVHAAHAAAARGEVTLVDVREDDEYAEGHPAGARHLALSRLPEALGELPEGSLALSCRSGTRSQKAGALVLLSGRTDVKNVTGGLLAWQEAGLPTEATPAHQTPQEPA